MQAETTGTPYAGTGGKTTMGTKSGIQIPHFGFKPLGTTGDYGAFEAVNKAANDYVAALCAKVPAGNEMILLEVLNNFKANYWQGLGMISATSVVGNV